MITTIVIMTLSLAMFVYWFRYSCILILESDWNEEKAREFAAQNKLAFDSSDALLARSVSAVELDRLRDSLDRDLRAIRRLTSDCPGLRETGASLESRMLMIDFHLMKAWYAVTRSMSQPKAHQALRSMSKIVGYMAGELGDQMVTARG